MADSDALFDIQIDTTEMEQYIEALAKIVTPARFQSIMLSELKRVQGRVKKIIGQDLPIDYEVKATYAKSFVKNATTTFNGSSIKSVIPITGTRGTVGGTFHASGGARGWQSLRKKYRVKTKLVKGKVSTLPVTMEHQGDQKPFRNLSAVKLHKATFTRVGEDRLPIVRVSGIGVPQMPLNKTRTRIQDDIMTMLENRMEHVLTRQIQKLMKK